MRRLRQNALSMVTVGLVLMASCRTNEGSKKNDLAFNSEQWKAGNMREKGKMTDNLINDSLLVGKTKSEVLELLGEPDQQTKALLHYTVDPGIKYMGESWTYYFTVEIDSIHGKVKSVWLMD